MPQSSTALAREIRTIKTSFHRLAKSFGRIAPLLAASAARGESGEKTTRRKPRLSQDQRRALKLQGKYMGTMRGLSAAQRSKIKRIRSKQGIRAAIAAARKLTNSK